MPTMKSKGVRIVIRNRQPKATLVKVSGVEMRRVLAKRRPAKGPAGATPARPTPKGLAARKRQRNRPLLPVTCTKLYSDLPFAHRQHTHKGHCALIHGHNWSFELTFGACQLDDNGFVFDFGALKPVKQWFEDMFDHTLLLNENDPHLEYLREALCGMGEPPGHRGLQTPREFAKIVEVPNCGAEGLAKLVLEQINKNFFDPARAPWLADERFNEASLRGCRVIQVRASEDSKNWATYVAEQTAVEQVADAIKRGTL